MTEVESLQAKIDGFRRLGSGWDGETAEKPSEASIKAAMLYAEIRQDLADLCDATLHVDGSVMLEADDDTWTIRFTSSGGFVIAGKVPSPVGACTDKEGG